MIQSRSLFQQRFYGSGHENFPTPSGISLLSDPHSGGKATARDKALGEQPTDAEYSDATVGEGKGIVFLLQAKNRA